MALEAVCVAVTCMLLLLVIGRRYVAVAAGLGIFCMALAVLCVCA